MNVTLKERLIERIQQLLNEAEAVKNTSDRSGDTSNFWYVDDIIYHKWKVNAKSIIDNISSKDSSYYENFVKHVGGANCKSVDIGIGILKGLSDDFRQGFIDDPMNLARVEVFSDFLGMAKDLLNERHKDLAAFLISAVLEDSLKKLSKKNNISVKDSDDIASLNTKLADNNVYSRIDQKQIQVWKDIRDSVVHANFDDYTDAQVKEMMNGVIRFLSENLKQ